VDSSDNFFATELLLVIETFFNRPLQHVSASPLLRISIIILAFDVLKEKEIKM
jgi:hypothetical protein